MAKFTLWVALYPIVAHIGIQTSNIFLPVVYLTILVLFSIYPLKIKSYIFKGILVAAVISSALLIIILDKEYIAIQLVPMLTLSVLILIFLKSLVFDNTPIITQFAACVDERPLNSEKKKYTRNITTIWLLGFVYMFVQNIMIALWFSVETWSWASNTGSYILIALIMFGEFLYRNKKFTQDKISFKTFIMRLSRCRLRQQQDV